jgi:hypothetical protein
MASTRRRTSFIVGVATIACLALPAATSAATRYVDLDTGDVANDCLTIGAPCKSIQQALTQSGTDPDTIAVDDDTYAESNLNVGDGKTLTGMDFIAGDTGATIIDAGNVVANPVIVTGGGATVSNLTLRNDSHRLILVGGPATITGNTFDEEAPVTADAELVLLAAAGNTTVTGNIFQKGSCCGTAIRSLSTGSPTISGNTITHYNGGIDLQAGTPVVMGNEITALNVAGSCDPCAGIQVSNSQATLIANWIHDPADPVGYAMVLRKDSVLPATGAALARNLLSGGKGGFRVNQQTGTIGPITMFGDAILDYSEAAISTTISGPTTATLTATNVTLASSQPGITADIAVNRLSLVLNSSIVFNAGIAPTDGATCSISFSRGPVSMDTADGCSNFQTTAGPMFAAAGDFLLLPGSPMIDAGDPTAPLGGATDRDGDPRAVDRTLDCSAAARRDIGADEVTPAVGVLDCSTPVSADLQPPDTTASGKAKVKTRKKKAKVTWTFGSTEPGSFQCSLDGAPFSPCAPPFSAKLRRGAHTLRVRATDSAGNTDASPASFTTRVKRIPPG